MAGGYPCCCPSGGSTLAGSSHPGGPMGSSGGEGGDLIVRGSSFAGATTCPSFAGPVSPAVLRVEVNGVTAKACADCGLLNGVFFVPAVLIDHPSRCGWQLDFPAVCGHYSVIYVELFAADVGDYIWSVALSDRPFVEGQELLLITGGQTTAGQITIADVNNVPLTVASEVNTTRCTALGGASALISAVV